MKSPVGIVVAVDPPEIIVDVEAAPLCRRCASGKGCGAGLLSGAEGTRRIAVPQPEGSRLAPGDHVILELGSRTLLRAAALAYGMPLAAMIVTLLVGSVIAGPLAETAAVLLAAAGLAGGLGISRWRLAGRCERQFTPEIRAVFPGTAAHSE